MIITQMQVSAVTVKGNHDVLRNWANTYIMNDQEVDVAHEVKHS